MRLACALRNRFALIVLSGLTFLHLSYSCAPQKTHAALVTHDPMQTYITPRASGEVGIEPDRVLDDLGPESGLTLS